MPRAKKRKDGRYKTSIYLGRDENGDKKYKQVYATSPAELKDKEAEVRHQLGLGLDMLAGRDAFDRWADDFLRIKATEGISDKQADHYRVSAEWWKTFLQGYEISDVRPDDIERGLLKLGETRAKRTVQFYRSTIRQIMERASERVIPYNPEHKVKLKKDVGRPQNTRRALTAEEQQWIWDTPGRGQAVAVIMMLSGLRRGELSAMTWNDIDTKAGTIRVNKSIEYLSDGTPHLKMVTKTEAGMRTVDIPQKLCEYLDAMPKDSALVVHTQAGGIMTESAWVKLWSSYMRQLNIKYGSGIVKHQDEPGRPGPKTYEMTIPPITMHWLRHTFCTLLYLAGVDVVQACAEMGHADVSTTLKIYTHLDSVHKRKSVDKLDAYLGSCGSKVVQKSR
jgi:integrase